AADVLHLVLGGADFQGGPRQPPLLQRVGGDPERGLVRAGGQSPFEEGAVPSCPAVRRLAQEPRQHLQDSPPLLHQAAQGNGVASGPIVSALPSRRQRRPDSLAGGRCPFGSSLRGPVAERSLSPERNAHHLEAGRLQGGRQAVRFPCGGTASRVLTTST